MKAIKTFAITLLASMSLSTPLMAGSADFAGIFGGISASVTGASIDGTHTSGTSSSDSSANTTVNKGGVGAFMPVGGFEAGFNLPLGDIFFIGVGGKLVKGSATLAESDESTTVADISIEGRDAETVYIQPSISLFDNSAMYVKWGTTSINVEAVGDVTKVSKFDLDGSMYAVGMLTQFNSGIYVRTEASATQFDQISVTGVGTNSTAVIEGDPILAQGTLALGYKF